MSGRGIDFLENWIQQKAIVKDKNCTHQRAAELAAHCIQEAAHLGLSIDEMEPEFGSVQTIIHETAHYEMEEELNFWKTYAAARDK